MVYIEVAVMVNRRNDDTNAHAAADRARDDRDVGAQRDLGVAEGLDGLLRAQDEHGIVARSVRTAAKQPTHTSMPATTDGISTSGKVR